MRFNHPEILVLLFLLIIPVLIHLFQLQRFRKEAFTNVKFLREIKRESRKSSRLKKLLILATRMLAFAFLILAFAQPVLLGDSSEENRRTVVYIDNSLSMQAKDRNGSELLQSLKGSLIEQLEAKSTEFSLITNDRVIEGLDLSGFRQEVLSLEYHPVRKDLSQVILEAQTLNRNEEFDGLDMILFSDFRRTLNGGDSSQSRESDRYYLVPVRAEPYENLTLDSLWANEADRSNLVIQARIGSHSVDQENLSVSLVLNGNLFGKTSQSVENGKFAVVEFSIPVGVKGNGAMTFSDPRLGFDNSIFFILPEKIAPKVLVIGKRSAYLSSIYDTESFDLQFRSIAELDQGSINDFDLILLNEPRNIPVPLIQTLKSFAEETGNLVFIPHPDPDMPSYQDLISTFGLGTLTSRFDQKKLISSVNYDHPFFDNVFKGKVTNFEYPEVSSGLIVKFRLASTLLGFEDGSDFISEIPFGENTIYWVSSPLDGESSNFGDSPLIVPVFFNFSLPENKTGGLYKIIGRSNELLVDLESPGETALKMTNGVDEFIPLQRSVAGEVTLFTKEYPLAPGIYQVTDGDKVISEYAFNYDRELVRTDYQDLSELKNLLNSDQNVRILSSPEQGLNELNAMFSNRALWHIFIIFALIFILLEMLIHRFFKI